MGIALAVANLQHGDTVVGGPVVASGTRNVHAVSGAGGVTDQNRAPQRHAAVG